MTGADDHTVVALPHDRLREVFKKVRTFTGKMKTGKTMNRRRPRFPIIGRVNEEIHWSEVLDTLHLG